MTATTTIRICTLPGDGIGPEVTAAALSVARAAGDAWGFAVESREEIFGGASIDATGDPFPRTTREACEGSDAVLLGAVGGPRWDTGTVRPEQGLLALRRVLGCYANIRPVARWTRHITSPLRADLAENIDFVIVRELTGGLYFGDRGREGDRAFDTCVYTADEVRRIARRAFRLAQARSGRLTSVDKANILTTSKLWREVVEQVHGEFPEVELEHQLVDSMAMKLVEQPAAYDVIVTENMFGDILSDLAASVGGGIGLAPSASLADGGPGIFEPIHGTAPDIAGLGKANPAGSILSVAMLLDERGQPAAARAIEAAVRATLDDGPRTPDLGGTASTDEVAEAIAGAVRAAAQVTPSPA